MVSSYVLLQMSLLCCRDLIGLIFFCKEQLLHFYSLSHTKPECFYCIHTRNTSEYIFFNIRIFEVLAFVLKSLILWTSQG